MKTVRAAFTMELKAGHADEYRRRHDEIWPEIGALLREAGIQNYSIYLDESTNILFAVQELVADNTTADLAKNPIMQKWWNYMKDIMHTNADNSPITTPLREVFRME